MIKTIPESGWIPIFAAGKHTDMFGRMRVWTEQDLDTIIERSNPSQNDAPAVFGHPETAAPRYGTVSALQRNGKLLCAKFKDVVESFADAVNKKLYPDRSVGIDKNLRLTHVGFLGAHAPAVEGLPPATFAAPDQEDFVYQFSAYEMSTIGRMFQRIRDYFLEKFGAEAADKVIPQWDIDYLKEIKDDTRNTSAFSANSTEEGQVNITIPELQAALAQKETQLAQFAADKTSQTQEITTLKAEIETLKGQLHQQFFASRKKDFETFIDGLVTEGKVVPAIKTDLVDCLEIMHNAGEYCFASAGANTKKPAVDVFKNLLSAFPKQVHFGEHVKRQPEGEETPEMQFGASVDQERMQIHVKALDIQKTDKISYEEAIKKAMK